jgi:hypothetical protein
VNFNTNQAPLSAPQHSNSFDYSSFMPKQADSPQNPPILPQDHPKIEEKSQREKKDKKEKKRKYKKEKKEKEHDFSSQQTPPQSISSQLIPPHPTAPQSSPPQPTSIQSIHPKPIPSQSTTSPSNLSSSLPPDIQSFLIANPQFATMMLSL